MTKENISKEVMKNTVSARDQLEQNQYVTLEGKENRGVGILFIGNSITRHAPKPEIGWNNDWGMAASVKEKDYVHRIMEHVRMKDPCAKFCIAQVANWERQYWKEDALEGYHDAVIFKPDIIITKIGENVPRDRKEEPSYKACFEKLIDYFNKDGNAKVLVSTSFWRVGDIDEAMREVAGEREYPNIELGDLGEQDKMKAIGLFKHTGVANHPGDLGMEAIANAIFNEISKIL